jgi:hypothetical protein
MIDVLLGEEDDDDYDYDDTNDRYHTLCEQGQEILDVDPDLHKTISHLKILSSRDGVTRSVIPFLFSHPLVVSLSSLRSGLLLDPLRYGGLLTDL